MTSLTPPLKLETHFALVIPPVDALMLGVLLTSITDLPEDQADDEGNAHNIAMLAKLGEDLLERLELSGILAREDIPAEAPEEFEIAVTYASVRVIIDANDEVHIASDVPRFVS